MTIAIVLVNVVVYLLEIRHGGSFFGGPVNGVEVHYGAIPYELTHPGTHCDLVEARTRSGLAQAVGCQRARFTANEPGLLDGTGPQLPAWETVFTAMFLHANFLHIFGNMVFLAIFGSTVENSTGRLRYTAFYLIGGVVALASQVATDPSSTGPTLGASGAIAAVLGGYIVLYPRARVLTLVLIVFLVTIIEIPAVWLLGFWFAEQVFLGVEGLNGVFGGEGVAYFAHIGGFLFGVLVIRLLARRRAPAPVPSRAAT